MAANSKREQIIVYAKTLIEGVSSIKTVVRVKQVYSDLQQFSLEQLPIAAIVAGLPVPTEKVSGRGPSNVELIISELTLKIVVYAQDNENPDTTVSTLSDDIWAKLYSDQQFGNGQDGLILGHRLIFDTEPQFWEPYVAFQLNCVTRYKHLKGGI